MAIDNKGARHRASVSIVSILALLLSFGTTAAKAQSTAETGWTLMIHGGAGGVEGVPLSRKREAVIRAGLERALAAGAAVLDADGSAVEAVEAAIRVLEDDPNFNAGRGAALTAERIAELDASIMDGATRRAGAVAGVTTTKNPIRLARMIMDGGQQVMFAGAGADRKSKQLGLEQVEPAYFITEERIAELRAHQAHGASKENAGKPTKYGTVGAVARDRAGHLAAGTSTGGLMGKPPGRVGDSPIIGAGTYADDRACAVSATGAGEFYIRIGVAHSICDRMRYLEEGPQAAADAVQAETLALGGKGGVIVMAPNGSSAWSFNTAGMFRGVQRAGSKAVVAIYADK